MRVTSLGHAGLCVETSGARLLCDPWLSPEGAFQASWFQYPDNVHLMSDELCSPSAVVLTQGERDRVDPWLLARLAANAPAIACTTTAPSVRRLLQESAPRRIIAAAPWQRIEVAPGTTLHFVPEDSPLSRRAAVVLREGDETLVDLGGTRLAPIQLDQIREATGGKIDLLCVQGATTSWYPSCYEYTDERRREAARQKRLARFAYIVRAIHMLKPTHVMPFGGHPCFLDPELAHHNDGLEPGGFPDQKQYIEWLADRGITNAVAMMPGDSWDISRRRRETDATWDAVSLSNRKRYLADYAERRRPHVEAVLARYPEPRESLWDSFRDYFEHLLELSPYFNERIGIRIGFHVTGDGGGDWSVDFRPGSRGVRPTLDDCGYEYKVAGRWAQPLFRRELAWDDFLFSLRLTARRSADKCNDHVRLLRFADETLLRAVEQRERTARADDTIAVHSGGHVYDVQRFCPHDGNDLLDCGEVLPSGVLRCLAHRYDYSLSDGACLNGRSARLRVTRGAPEPMTPTPMMAMPEWSA